MSAPPPPMAALLLLVAILQRRAQELEDALDSARATVELQQLEHSAYRLRHPERPHRQPTTWHRRLETRPVQTVPLPRDGTAA